VTLILAGVSRDYAVLLSDRRFSRRGHTPADEEGKAGVVTCADARLAFAFSGLAQADSFSTYEWILSTLRECCPPYESEGVLRLLCERLDEKFGAPPLRNLPAEHRRLSVLFAGFVYLPGKYMPAGALITNHYDPATRQYLSSPAARFTLRYGVPDKRGPCAAFWSAGQSQLLKTNHVSPLRAILVDGRPPEAFVGKGVEVMREVARQAQAKETIGGQISSLVLRPDRRANPDAGYHSEKATPTVYFPGEVTCHPAAPKFPVIAGWQITGVNRQVMAVPKVHRNAPCPCGSGKKYQDCHAQQRPRMS
jgi:hypothetical protein